MLIRNIGLTWNNSHNTSIVNQWGISALPNYGNPARPHTSEFSPFQWHEIELFNMKIEFSLVYHLTMSRNIASANHPCPQALALAHAHMQSADGVGDGARSTDPAFQPSMGSGGIQRTAAALMAGREGDSWPAATRHRRAPPLREAIAGATALGHHVETRVLKQRRRRRGIGETHPTGAAQRGGEANADRVMHLVSSIWWRGKDITAGRVARKRRPPDLSCA